MSQLLKRLPPLLTQIPKPPPQLYIEGNATLLSTPSMAVVGSRAMTAYGEAATRYYVEHLVQAGFTIVSGLATGIDAVAHQTALEVGGNTIAVLGCGCSPSVLFPADHRKLAQRILQSGGTLVSEYPDTTPAQRYMFIARNRILAGLSLGTIVIEAAQRSGALNTAYHTLDTNRPVFAVPGSIFSSRSKGTHRLLREGAILADDISVVLEELGLKDTQLAAQSLTRLPPLQQRICEQLQAANLSLEELTQHTGIAIEVLQASLTELEIQGIVRKNLFQNYQFNQ